MIRIRGGGYNDFSGKQGVLTTGWWRSGQGSLLWELQAYTCTLVNIAEGELGRAKKVKDFGNEINTMISQSLQFA